MSSPSPRGVSSTKPAFSKWIFASGSLNETEIAKLVAAGAPINGFGVGTDMGVSRDAPALDIAYKLVEYAGRGRLKLSTGKAVLPGRKQIVRVEQNGIADHDVLARHDELLPGRPLMTHVMRGGERLPDGRVSLNDARSCARREVDRLPAGIRGLEPPQVLLCACAGPVTCGVARRSALLNGPTRRAIRRDGCVSRDTRRHQPRACGWTR